jgi:hypothetical protein
MVLSPAASGSNVARTLPQRFTEALSALNSAISLLVLDEVELDRMSPDELRRRLPYPIDPGSTDQ